MTSEWLSTDDAADLAGTDRQAVYKAVDKGRLPAYRVGRVFRYRRAEAAAWVAGGDWLPHVDEQVKAQAVGRLLLGDSPDDIVAAL